MIITIGGLPGTGTTTIAKLICEKYNLKHVCAGFIFRDMAKEKNMTVEEFSTYAEQNPEIDHEIDRIQVEMAKEGNIVLEGRLANWMLKNNAVEPTVSIWLKAPPKVRCERITERDNEESISIALKKMMDREKSEKKRYKELYNINIDDLSIYDLIINSSTWDIEGVFSIVDMAINHKSKK